MEHRKAISLILTFTILVFLTFRIVNEFRKVGTNGTVLKPTYLGGTLVLGTVAFLVYTGIWYFLLATVREVNFRDLVLLNLVGNYLSMSLNSAVGGVVKAKYSLSDWGKALGIVGLATVVELLPGSIVALVSGHWMLLPGIILLLWAIIHEDSLYPLVAFPFKLVGREELIYKFYLGWKASKKGLPKAILIAPFHTLTLAMALTLTGRAFGASISLKNGFVSVVYSTVIGGVLGTPGGIGGNELGVMLAIGDVPMAVTIAFTYKFLTQYVFAVAGAVPFYRLIAGEHSV